jgi:hypothetical protein
MQIGDLVMHKATGYTAVILQLPRSTSDAGMITVLTFAGQGHWRMSSCEVVSLPEGVHPGSGHRVGDQE